MCRMYRCICLVSVVPATRMESTMTDYCELSAQQQLIITITGNTRISTSVTIVRMKFSKIYFFKYLKLIVCVKLDIYCL